ncbi:MarR family winged helix-turn-helix transcriptional regulator [Janthinobacterium psychrotolerans]|uniref:DNA-binding transcriptional regulator, MarR family n=1 Tax=Janthinobacterium psychrotolerans TaxID=1747903 RepID=A0A1A7C933_9BURK|nr:MarR family winged helix-turn-helix transcriptional regulator [Janthinobacterium psychrotolerans]OBV41280.1 DNA-binding transcriptional regulator, MarR family [Janthinobacterium psychrotolerans]
MRNNSSPDPDPAPDPAPTRPGGKRPPRLFNLLSQARQNLFRSADAVFASELGYSGTQVVALFVLKSEEGCQLKDLGRLLQLKNSAVTGLVSRMEENGLIVRRQSALDARAGSLHLSPKGHEVLAAALPVLDSLNAQLKQGFTEEELAVVARFLIHAAGLRFEQDHPPSTTPKEQDHASK